MSEGTYPYTMGGVSVWCDQLIRGLPDHRWDVVPLTVDGTERVVWDSPDNVDCIRSLPLWGSSPSGRRRSTRPGAEFVSAHEAFLTTLLTPTNPRSIDSSVNRSRFMLALRELYEYAAQGGDLTDALTCNRSLTQMMDAWHGLYGDTLTLADALEASWLLEHMLRPLSAPPVEADVVHASMNGLCMLVAMTAKWRHGSPVIMSEHGLYLRERYLAYLDDSASHAVKVLVLSFFRALAGAGYVVADALAPHSTYNRRWQLHNGAAPEQISTMYNGVSPDDFPVSETEPDVPTIVFMGRIDPLKDVHTLLRAFALVRAEMPTARLRVFGGTPAGNEVYQESCQRLIEELGLGGAAVLEGRVDAPADAYRAGTIVALTSISEGFPYTVVEAMACGRAVVCTNVGGVAEAVADGGIVVPPRDERAVADACLSLLRNGALRRCMAAAGRARMLKMFTLERSLDAYRMLYRHVTAPVAPPYRRSRPVQDGAGPPGAADPDRTPPTATAPRAVAPAAGS